MTPKMLNNLKGWWNLKGFYELQEGDKQRVRRAFTSGVVRAGWALDQQFQVIFLFIDTDRLQPLRVAVQQIRSPT